MSNDSIGPLQKPDNFEGMVEDRTDISRDAKNTTLVNHHIEKVLGIRERHGGPKELITSILEYIHEEFARFVPELNNLPKKWQQCIQDEMTSGYIQVYMIHSHHAYMHITRSDIDSLFSRVDSVHAD